MTYGNWQSGIDLIQLNPCYVVTDIASGVDPEVHDLLQAMPQTIRLRTLS